MFKRPAPRAPRTERAAYIADAVTRARAFNRAVVRLQSGTLSDQRLAEEARRRRDRWLAAARHAKAHGTVHA